MKEDPLVLAPEVERLSNEARTTGVGTKAAAAPSGATKVETTEEGG